MPPSSECPADCAHSFQPPTACYKSHAECSHIISKYRTAIHDVRNLLSAAGMRLGQLQASLSAPNIRPEPADKVVTVAYETITCCLDIMTSLHSGDGAGADESAWTVDLCETVKSVAVMVRRLVPHDVLVSIASGCDQPRRTWISPQGLSRCLLELGLNAGKALTPGGGSIAFSLESVIFNQSAAASLDLAPGSYYVVAVSDNGHGMDDQTICLAVQPGFSTADELGHGYGLCQASEFATSCGGKLTVSSRLGQGSTIRLYLRDCQPQISG